MLTIFYFWVDPLNWPVIKTLSHWVYLGACPRTATLLRKIRIWPFSAPFPVKYTYIRLKKPRKLTQTSFPSGRSQFSDRHLVIAKYRHHISAYITKTFGIKTVSCISGICNDKSTDSNPRRD
jgi:hypothetical protein